MHVRSTVVLVLEEEEVNLEKKLRSTLGGQIW